MEYRDSFFTKTYHVRKKSRLEVIMSIVITQQNNPLTPEHARQYAIYNGLILNWQVRAIEQLARELGTNEDEIVMTALSLFLALHSERIDLRDAVLFDRESPGMIVNKLTLQAQRHARAKNAFTKHKIQIAKAKKSH
jgi:hypothetical protein